MSFESRFARIVARLPFAEHRAFRYRPALEGYRDYTFGGRAGPQISVINLLHELGHAADFSDKFRYRAMSTGFVFKVPQKFVYDRFVAEPTTCGATDRELTAFAHQYILMKLIGYKVNINMYSRHMANVIVYMHDWWQIPVSDRSACVDQQTEQRVRYCVEGIIDRIRTGDVNTTVNKIVKWLDSTAKRLDRQNKTPI